jgi:hypothetical protein
MDTNGCAQSANTEVQLILKLIADSRSDSNYIDRSIKGAEACLGYPAMSHRDGEYFHKSRLVNCSIATVDFRKSITIYVVTMDLYSGGFPFHMIHSCHLSASPTSFPARGEGRAAAWCVILRLSRRSPGAGALRARLRGVTLQPLFAGADRAWSWRVLVRQWLAIEFFSWSYADGQQEFP